jgi:AraC-like DNA-binding protein
MSDDPIIERCSHAEYQEFHPGSVLGRDVVCLWTLRIGHEGIGHNQPIFPDGCIDIVWMDNRPPFVVGPMTRSSIYPLLPGTHVLGVRFFPGAAASCLRWPAHEFTDLEIPLRESWGDSAEALTAQLAEISRVEHKLGTLKAALESRWPPADKDRLVLAAVNWLAQHPAGNVRRLADILGVTSRHLHRRFSAAVGYGPKVFQRIARFQRLLHVADSMHPGAEALATLAFEAGYADQAHMTREFRQLACDTPGTLLFKTASALSMSDLFKT